MKARYSKSWLVVLAVGLAGAAAVEGCAKKGSGKGSRKYRPTFAEQGTIKDDGPKNQEPDGTDTDKDRDPKMDPEATALLAACFKVDVSEVAPVVGWGDATTARAAAQAICDKLTLVKYGDGVVATTAAVEVPVE